MLVAIICVKSGNFRSSFIRFSVPGNVVKRLQIIGGDFKLLGVIGAVLFNFHGRYSVNFENVRLVAITRENVFSKIFSCTKFFSRHRLFLAV